MMPVVPTALGILLGAVLWHHTPALPQASVTWGACAAGLLLFWLGWRSNGWRQTLLLLGATLLSWGSAAERSRDDLRQPLPEEFFTTPKVAVTLTVVDRIPLAGASESVVARLEHGPWNAKVRLAVPEEAQENRWLPGERYAASVHLRPVRATINPGTFDREWWAFRNGIAASGRVVEAQPLGLAPDRLLAFARLRAHLAERLDAVAPRHGAWLRALALGDRSSFDDETWQRVQRTGTAHLIAISGMHVALVAWLIGGLVQRFARRFPQLTLHFPAPRLGWAAAIAVAWSYAALAGLGIPAVRAALMLTLAGLSSLVARRLPTLSLLLLTLAVVLLWDPWAVGDAGFWLSFAAVAILLALGGGLGEHTASDLPQTQQRSPRAIVKRLHDALRPFFTVQGTMTLALVPITLLFFGQAALFGAIANFVAIPLVAYLATPLALLLLVAPLAPLGQLFDALIDRTLAVLAWAEQLPLATASAPQLPLWVWLVALVALLAALLLPKGLAVRLLALPALLLLFAATPDRPHEGAAWVTLLDVGQGQAILVTTSRHTLLYDAGPAWGRSDSGKTVVLPYLRYTGVKRLDGVVLSHFDSDHTGGFATLAEALPIGAVWVGAARDTEPPKPLTAPLSRLPVSTCARGTTWEWDGVRFTLLWPPPDARLRDDNAHSCTLLIESRGGSRFLVSGDLGVREERQLLTLEPKLSADLVVAGHHGSSTSSSSEWVQALRPQKVVVSVGAFNRFGHPRCAVVDRWERSGAQLLRTDRDGAIRAVLPADSPSPVVTTARESAPRYWHRPLPPFAACRP